METKIIRTPAGHDVYVSGTFVIGCRGLKLIFFPAGDSEGFLIASYTSTEERDADRARIHNFMILGKSVLDLRKKGEENG